MGAALIQAADEIGIRLTLLDTCYLAGGLTGHGHADLDEVQLRFSDGDVDAWHDRVSRLHDGDMLRIGAAAHSVRALPQAALKEFGAAVDQRVVHAHVSEQMAEDVAAQAFYGLTPTGLLDDAGLVTDRFTAVHGTNVTEADIGRLARAGSTVCFCPTTERDLADGIGPARRLVDAGAVLTLGSDSHAVIDLFEEMRAVEMHERLTTRERGHFASAELLAAATYDGHASLGFPDAGAIAVGRRADLVEVDLDTVRTRRAGATADTLVMAATGADVVTHGRSPA